MALTKLSLFTIAVFMVISVAFAYYPSLECDHANICIALDGSNSISDEEFRFQRNFAKQMISDFGGDLGTQFAVLQYGSRPRYISRLAGFSDGLLLRVNNTQSLGSTITYIAPAISSCMRQLRRRPGEPNKIIILGDGRSNFDAREPPFDPYSVAQVFLSDPNNFMSAVAVNFTDHEELDMLSNIVGGSQHVFTANSWFDVFGLVDDIVAHVCEGVPLYEPHPTEIPRIH